MVRATCARSPTLSGDPNRKIRAFNVALKIEREQKKENSSEKDG
jgi:hypothetical protein